MQNIKILLVCGCFPVQENIPKEKLYHQLLKRNIEDNFQKSIEIKILQYEKLTPVYKKIEKLLTQEQIDIIIFHIRIEQVLRIIKFYLRYHFKDNSYHRNINFANLGTCIAEKPEFSLMRTNQLIYINNKNYFKTFFVNLNYILGYLVFNQLYAFQKYKSLIIDLIKHARQKHINVLFTGPVSRPNRVIENMTSHVLDIYLKKVILKRNGNYIRLFGMYENNEYLFCDDNIKVNLLGHKRISEIICKYLKSNFLVKAK